MTKNDTYAVLSVVDGSLNIVKSDLKDAKSAKEECQKFAQDNPGVTAIPARLWKPIKFEEVRTYKMVDVDFDFGSEEKVEDPTEVPEKPVNEPEKQEKVPSKNPDKEPDKEPEKQEEKPDKAPDKGLDKDGTSEDDAAFDALFDVGKQEDNDTTELF